MKTELVENNYIFVPNFILKDEADSLAQDFKTYALNNLLSNDPQAQNSECVYNFLPFVRLLVKKTSQVSELIGEEVLPTYTYARIYKENSILDKHKDRDACEISLTINLLKDADWPIYFEKPNGHVSYVELRPGDAAVYLGCDSWHWRERYSGSRYIQVFTHYVRSFGPRASSFFDIKR